MLRVQILLCTWAGPPTNTGACEIGGARTTTKDEDVEQPEESKSRSNEEVSK